MSAAWLSKQPSRHSTRTTSSHSSSASARYLADPRISADSVSGHLGHLSDAQERAFTHFKELCIKEKLYVPGSDERPPSHDDATMIRFLRARKFDAKAALSQFKDTQIWRQENKIDALYDNIDIKTYEEARRMYPQWIGRRDKRGIPIYVFIVRDLTSKNVAEWQKSAASTPVTRLREHKESKVPPFLLRLFALYENLLRFMFPVCTYLPDRPHVECPITATSNIVDISGVGLKQFWNLKAHMQAAATLATAHYPETLDRIFIIGAPSFFPTVWSWIKRWFDAGTTSKIFIINHHDTTKVLTSFIEPENLPKDFGGKLDWHWGDHPNLGEAEKKVLGDIQKMGGSHGWVDGPIVWEQEEGAVPMMVAVGSVNGRDRSEILGVAPNVADLKPHVQVSNPVSQNVFDGAAPEHVVDTASATVSLNSDNHQTTDTESMNNGASDRSDDTLLASEKEIEKAATQLRNLEATRQPLPVS